MSDSWRGPTRFKGMSDPIQRYPLVASYIGWLVAFMYDVDKDNCVGVIGVTFS